VGEDKTTKMGKPKATQPGDESVGPISRAEHRKIADRLAKRYDLLRKKYPEVHSKVVDSVNNSIEDGTLCFIIRFSRPSKRCDIAMGCWLAVPT
jgi:hypothetical protein